MTQQDHFLMKTPPGIVLQNECLSVHVATLECCCFVLMGKCWLTHFNQNTLLCASGV